MSRGMKIIIAVAVIVILGAGALFAGWRSASENTSSEAFQIVDTLPKTRLATSSDTIVIDFNRTLKAISEQPEDFISYNQEIVETRTKIKDKTLTLTINEKPASNATFIISLNNIEATDGSTLSTTVDYFVEFIPYNELSQEERDLQASSEGRPKDKNPLLSRLPYDEISFRITYAEVSDSFGAADDWRGEKDNYVVYINTFAPNYGIPAEEYREKTLVLRDKALEWIRKQGVDPDTEINIIYSPTDDEINGGEEFTGDGAPPTTEDFGL